MQGYKNEILDKLNKSLEPVCTAFSNEASISTGKSDMHISYHTRKYTVHPGNKTGQYSKDTKEIAGPDFDGFIVDINLAEGRYMGQWVRPGFVFEPDKAMREPYFYVCGAAFYIEKFDINLMVNVYFSTRTDKEFLKTLTDKLSSTVKSVK